MCFCPASFVYICKYNKYIYIQNTCIYIYIHISIYTHIYTCLLSFLSPSVLCIISPVHHPKALQTYNKTCGQSPSPNDERKTSDARNAKLFAFTWHLLQMNGIWNKLVPSSLGSTKYVEQSDLCFGFLHCFFGCELIFLNCPRLSFRWRGAGVKRTISSKIQMPMLKISLWVAILWCCCNYAISVSLCMCIPAILGGCWRDISPLFFLELSDVLLGLPSELKLQVTLLQA